MKIQAWLEMIDKTKKDLVMISQWGIGKSGRGVSFFDHLKTGNYKSLLRNKRLLLKFLPWQNTSKFAILLEYKNPCKLFCFSICGTLFFP